MSDEELRHLQMQLKYTSERLRKERQESADKDKAIATYIKIIERLERKLLESGMAIDPMDSLPEQGMDLKKAIKKGWGH